MCSESRLMALAMLMAILVSCSPYGKIRQIRSGNVSVGLSVSDEEKIEEDDDKEVLIDSIRSSLSDEPIIMNAIRDTETGEMVATDVINASKVTARFRNVAERAGYVSISFDVSVPSAMSDSQWQLKILPFMSVQEDVLPLDALYITGTGYRQGQLKGYQRYKAFLASIITDTTDFIRMRQLEVFLERHYPETYAMRTDSTIIPEPKAENLFGVTQREALEHYTRHLKHQMNERRKARAGKMFERYVKDPIVTEGIRLDTVLTDSDGDFIYRYVHTFRSRPGLKKVAVSLEGRLFEKGECICELPFAEELTFYISSLSSLVDDRVKYRMTVLERSVKDNTKAFIDFRQGSSAVDTTLGDNADELRRVVRCIDDVVAREDLELDSLVIVASCSPEGPYALNRKLSASRSEAVRKYIGDYVPVEWKDSLRASELPENWEQLEKLVANDTILSERSRKNILTLMEDLSRPDVVEKRISMLPEYRYLREKIYPKLRSVRFDFHMHRSGMVRDTVHTTEIDSVYMSGVEALKLLDYKKAVTILRPYDDYNAALAFMSADYNHSALDVLGRLEDKDPKVCYLKAMVLSRLGQHEEALKYYDLCLAYDPYMRHRANLDPEMHLLVRKRDEH
ncbi:MAG: tetratricopeptide repeat protein [Bacteroidales bacterium]|nr:tetratricopeptide repeat protein [Bacteroidales bacterium]